MMKRGDVYWVSLDPTRGSEIKKLRSCVLIGATPISQARHAVVVVPLSTSAKPRAPIAIPVRCLGKQVVAVCDQVRAVDKSRLTQPAGSLSNKDMRALEDGLKQVLALQP